MLTANEFAKHFDLAILAPNTQEADILAGCRTAAEYQVNTINVNSCWVETAKHALEGSGVGYSAVIGFPYGTPISKVKYLELEEMLNLGCTACDMVINVGALKDGNLDDTRLIICSIAGSRQYPELDKLLVEDEFRDVLDKIVITTEPIYLAQYTASPQIITYQRRFMNAVNNTADKR